ncbi:CaiB/BaiF CoA transferase family protein [Pseudonocardia sp.]|uniref:CaiB/BaiF CoA transferase family protein n=1 Tax=Pseudonocardia sp. TaxID=60912 RepID=UPI003D0A9D41
MAPLSGIKVLEVAQFWFVPSACALLADWGADVIKVEAPMRGDAMRGLIASGAVQATGQFNFMMEQPNRNKRSIGIDLAAPEGLALLYELVAQADVFVTNFMPDARQRLKIDVDDVKRVKPSIVYARGHGYGVKGADAGRGSNDGTAFYARSGIANRVTPVNSPTPAPTARPAFGDGISGMALAGAIAAALLGRERNGHAPVVDVSLLGVGMWQVAADIVAAAEFPGGLDLPAHDTVPNPLVNMYRTKDGRWLQLATLQADRYWPDFCERVGRTDLIADTRFSTHEARQQNRAACIRELDTVFGARTFAEWRAVLETFDGQWDLVQSPSEVLGDPQVLANGFMRPVEYSDGVHHLVDGPAQFDTTPNDLTRAPEVGEHTEQILLELGLDWARIGELKDANAIT